MYYTLLALLHNIGIKEALKLESPFISTTTSLDTAFKFSRSKTKKYAFLILYGDQQFSDCFTTDKLNKILDKMGIKWHENINKEILFKDAIFPHSILGIIEKKDENYTLIVNPNLLKFF